MEEAEKQFEIKLEERVISRRGELEKIGKFQESLAFGEQPIFKVRTAAEFVAIGVGGLIPLGVQAVGLSFISEGLPKITGGKTITERALGVAEVGFGLVGGGLAVKQAERLVDIALVKELTAQRGTLIGKELLSTKEGALFKTTSLRQLGEGGPAGTIKTKLTTPVFKTGKDTFSITGGKGTSVLKFKSFETGKDIKITEDFVFGARGSVSQQAPKIISKDLIIELEEFTGSFGSGFVRRRGEETFKEFKFGGISRDIQTDFGKITQVRSGEQTSLRLEGVTRLRRGGLLFKEAKGIFKIQETGIIKRLGSQQGESLGLVSPAKIKKTSFATTFQELKVETLVPTGISGQIEKQLFVSSEIIKPSVSVSRSLIGIPRAVGGEGLTETQLLQARGGLAQIGVVQPGLLPPLAPTGLGKTFETLDVSGGIGFKFDIGLISKTLQEPKTKLFPRLEIGQVPKFREALLEAQAFGQLEAQAFGQSTIEFQIPKQALVSTLVPPIRRGGFEPLGGFRIPLFIPPFPSLGGSGTRRRPKRRARSRTRIAPSFTGIVLGIEEAAKPVKFFGVDLGILPGQIRGLETGFEVPKKKKKKKSKKKS